MPGRININKRHCELEDENKVYLFWRTLEQCDSKFLQSYVSHNLAELEEKHNISHNTELQACIDSQQISNLQIDPLLPLVLGSKIPVTQKEILDFLGRELVEKNKKKFIAYVDLCLIFGDIGRASDFEKKCDKHDWLELIKNNDGKMVDAVIEDELVRFWLHDKNKDDSTDFTSLLLRVLMDCNGSFLASTISELWGKGYYWDAFCLAITMLPGNNITIWMRAHLEHILGKNPKIRTWLRVARYVTALRESETMHNFSYDEFDPITAYRLYKIDVASLEAAHMNDNDGLEAMSRRQWQSQELHKIVSSCLVSSEPALAEDIASDAVAYLKEIAPKYFQDYFPQATRLIFEPAVHMLARITSAMNNYRLNAVGKRTQDRHKLETKGNNSIMNDVVSHWLSLETGKEIWKNLQSNAQPFKQLCSQLRSHIEIKDTDKSNTTKITFFALWLAEELASGTISTKTDFAREVEKMAKHCGISENDQKHFVRYVIKDFDPNPASWSIIESKQLDVNVSVETANSNTEIMHEKTGKSNEIAQTYFSAGKDFIEHCKNPSPLEDSSIDNETNILLSHQNQLLSPEKKDNDDNESRSVLSNEEIHHMDVMDIREEESTVKKFGNSGDFAIKTQDWSKVQAQKFSSDQEESEHNYYDASSVSHSVNGGASQEKCDDDGSPVNSSKTELENIVNSSLPKNEHFEKENVTGHFFQSKDKGQAHLDSGSDTPSIKPAPTYATGGFEDCLNYGNTGFSRSTRVVENRHQFGANAVPSAHAKALGNSSRRGGREYDSQQGKGPFRSGYGGGQTNEYPMNQGLSRGSGNDRTSDRCRGSLRTETRDYERGMDRGSARSGYDYNGRRGRLDDRRNMVRRDGPGKRFV